MNSTYQVGVVLFARAGGWWYGISNQFFEDLEFNGPDLLSMMNAGLPEPLPDELVTAVIKYAEFLATYHGIAFSVNC